MVIRNINVPTPEIVTAIKTAKAAVKKLDALNAEIAEIGSEADALNRGGTAEVERRANRLEIIARDKMRIKTEALFEISKAKEAATNSVFMQSMPAGADTQTPDFLLLANGLVNTADELDHLAANNQNVTFLRMAEKYAKDHEWDFQYVDNSKTVSDFCGHVFDVLDISVQESNGLTRMQYIDTPGEFTRVCREYGLTDDTSAMESAATE